MLEFFQEKGTNETFTPYPATFLKVYPDLRAKIMREGPKQRAFVLGLSYSSDRIVIAFPDGVGFSYGAHELCHSVLSGELGKDLRLIMHGGIFSLKKGNNEKADHIVSIFKRPLNKGEARIQFWESGLLVPENYLNENKALTQSILTHLNASSLNVCCGNGTVSYFDCLHKR